MSQIPTSWLSAPFFKALRKAVKPATSWTRRRLVQVKENIPAEVFHSFTASLNAGDADGVVRDAEGTLVPTKTTAALKMFEYTIKKPTVTDKLFALQDKDPSPPPGARNPGAWRRGHGCANLVLSRLGHKKGGLGSKVAMVAGVTKVIYTEPKNYKGWPTLILRFFVLTMSHRGDITWPAKFTKEARALLRKQIRGKVESMLADPEYPIHSCMQQSLQPGGDTFLQLKASPRDPRHPLEAETPA